MTGKISDFASQTGANVADGDLWETVDISEGAAADRNKKMTTTEKRMAMSKRNRSYSTNGTGASITSSNQLPADGTIPQITEGVQQFSVSFTPTSTTSTVRIEVNMKVTGAATAAAAVVALFNGASNAIAADFVILDNGYSDSLVFVHEYVPGSTSAITFSVRCGPGAAYSIAVNNNAISTSRFSTLTIEEIHT